MRHYADVVLIITILAILTGVIAFPKESEVAAGKIIAGAQWAVTAVLPTILKSFVAEDAIFPGASSSIPLDRSQ